MAPPQIPALNDGRNNRGTYSREFVEQHPEVRWVHRGQGRYLPRDELNQAQAAPRPPTRFVPPVNSLLLRMEEDDRRFAESRRSHPGPNTESATPMEDHTFPVYEMAIDYNTTSGAPRLVRTRFGQYTPGYLNPDYDPGMAASYPNDHMGAAGALVDLRDERRFRTDFNPTTAYALGYPRPNMVPGGWAPGVGVVAHDPHLAQGGCMAGPGMGPQMAGPARDDRLEICLLYTSPSPRDGLLSRMPSSA